MSKIIVAKPIKKLVWLVSLKPTIKEKSIWSVTPIAVKLKTPRLPFNVSGGADRTKILASGIPRRVPTMAVTIVIKISLGVVNTHQSVNCTPKVFLTVTIARLVIITTGNVNINQYIKIEYRFRIEDSPSQCA